MADTGYRWKELQKLIGWDDASMERLKAEYERVKKEKENEGQGLQRIPRGSC